jgi:hypothetical protein
MIASFYPQLGWLGPRLTITGQNPHPPDVIGLAAPAAPSAEKLNAKSFDLDAVVQNKIATTIPLIESRRHAAPIKSRPLLLPVTSR